MNYTALVDDIKKHLVNENDEFVAQIDQFIRSAEEEVYGRVKIPDFRANSTSNMTIQNEYLDMPDGLLSVMSLRIVVSGEDVTLLEKDVDFIHEAYPNPDSYGQPYCYAIYDEDTFLIGPTPDQAYSVKLRYHKEPESITVAASGQTWLGDNYENVLLYGSLKHGYLFMRGRGEQFNRYSEAFERAMVALQAYSRGEVDTDTYRTQPERGRR